MKLPQISKRNKTEESLDDLGLASFTYKILTPDGKVFVTIAESDNKPIKILITVGKSGSAISAWANTVAELTSALFEKEASVLEILTIFTNIVSDRLIMHSSGARITSGVDGLRYCLLRYQEARMRRMEDG